MKYTLEQIKRGLDRYAGRSAPCQFTRGQKGVITGILNKACGSDAGRYAVLMWCFPDLFPLDPDNPQGSLRRVSSKDLTDSHWYALRRWIDPQRVPTGEYAYHAELEEECSEIWMDQAEKLGQRVVLAGELPPLPHPG